MFNRNARPRSLVNSLLMALVLAAGAWNTTVSAATAAQAGFRYDTSRLTTVDIVLAGSDSGPALLSFYSQGPNGLRLLENGFTVAAGNYAADMQLPAHLTEVVVVVRTAEREDTLTLAIIDQAIAYTE